VIKKKPKDKLSIYHDSFYRTRRKTSPITYLAIILFSATCLFWGNKLLAQTATEPAFDYEQLGSGQLLFSQQGESLIAASLLQSQVDFNINGMIASTTLKQSFLNQNNEYLNGTYAFPLPDNAAVNYLRIQIGERVIEGTIMERVQAKRMFQQAQAKGITASLVTQHRANIFTNNIANIAPKEQITITLKYIQTIDYQAGRFSLRFPMKITPRYTPDLKPNSPVDLISSSYNHPLLDTTNPIQIKVKLNAGIALEKINSPSHAIKLNTGQESASLVSQNTAQPAHQVVQINLNNIQEPMNKDFILEWFPEPNKEPTLSVFKESIDDEQFTLLMLMPPTQGSDNIPERDITFIIDTSGSMQGQSIIQAKKSLLFALNTLTPKDSFNLIAFSSSSQRLFNNTVMASPKHIRQAKQFIEQLSADGGTEMYRPLHQALSMSMAKKQIKNALRQILFITDGAVSNEVELFKLIHQTHDLPRIFTVGIGDAPNGYFMRKAAQFGRGSYTYIGDISEVQQKMSALLTKISQPALRNLSVQFQPLHLASIEQFPQQLPDVYLGEPILLSFKTKELPSSVQLFGDVTEQGWYQEVDLTDILPSKNTATVWARAKIEDLLDSLVLGKDVNVVKEKVLQTSLQHQVISPYSSFIAIEKQPEVDRTNTSKLTQQNQASVKTPFPQTSLEWQRQLLFAFILLLITLAYKRASNK